MAENQSTPILLSNDWPVSKNNNKCRIQSHLNCFKPSKLSWFWNATHDLRTITTSPPPTQWGKQDLEWRRAGGTNLSRWNSQTQPVHGQVTPQLASLVHLRHTHNSCSHNTLSVPEVMLADVCQCCCLLMFVCLLLFETFSLLLSLMNKESESESAPTACCSRV